MNRKMARERYKEAAIGVLKKIFHKYVWAAVVFNSYLLATLFLIKYTWGSFHYFMLWGAYAFALYHCLSVYKLLINLNQGGK